MPACKATFEAVDAARKAIAEAKELLRQAEEEAERPKPIQRDPLPSEMDK